jgi:K+-sensing histidine kinase KdpD
MEGKANMKDKESILLVDDDPGFRQVARAILRAKGYEVDTTSTAGEAISRAGERFYNVAVLDIGLPDIEGTELLSSLLQIHPDIVAIMLTGHSSVQNTVQSLNRGAFAYLEKPLDPERLLTVIGRGLEKQRLVRENRALLDQLAQRNRETGILLTVSQTLSQSLDLQQTIGSALKEVAESMGLSAAHVHILADDRLILEGSYGFSPQMREQLSQLVVNDGVVGTLIKEAKPVVVRNIDGNTDPVLAAMSGEGYQSYTGVPLAVAGETAGSMGVASVSQRDFTSREVELLTAIGREIAISVRNAQLYEEASSAKALRKLDALRTELLANVSHELRTPLAAIKGFASSLLQPDVSFDQETWQSFVQTIDKEADTLSRMIEELLLMSRIDAGALDVRRDCRSLAEVIDSVKDRLLNLALKHHLRFLVPSVVPPVAVDAVRIGEVLANLVENAVKYSAEGSPIRIEVHPNGKEVITSVIDNGAGIPVEMQNKVFDRFNQLENPAVGRRKGTGLGLCICRGIIEAHRGRIWVESEPGKGAKFSFSLPTEEG